MSTQGSIRKDALGAIARGDLRAGFRDAVASAVALVPR